MELWHVRIAESVAIDYRGRAYADTLAGLEERAKVERLRADAWDGLAERLRRAVKGDRPRVRQPDYELVRWYQLTLLKNCLGKGVKERSREISRLLSLMGDALAGRVENLQGVRHA